MNYLAVDTSGKNLTIIIKKDQKYYTYHDDECGVNHSVALMPEIEKLAKSANFDFKGADFFACVVGPGSFTGIRIGVATIKAMCFAFNKPCLLVTSFDALAYNNPNGKVLSLIDARHNGFYACGYDGEEIVLSPRYIMREEVEELLGEYSAFASTDIDGIATEKVSVLDGFIKAIESKLPAVTFDLESLTPLYVRKSQAEEGR